MDTEREMAEEDKNNNILFIQDKITNLMAVLQACSFEEKGMVLQEVNAIYSMVSKLSLRDSGSSQWNLKRPRPKDVPSPQTGFLSVKRERTHELRGEMFLGNSRLDGDRDKKAIEEIKNRARGVTPVLGILRSSLDKLETLQVKIYINNKAFKMFTLTLNTSKKELIQNAKRAFFNLTTSQNAKMQNAIDKANTSVNVKNIKYTISLWEEEKKHREIKEGTLFKLYVKEIMVDPTETKKLHFHRKRKEKESPVLPQSTEWQKVTCLTKQKFKLPPSHFFDNSKRRSKIIDLQRENHHEYISILKSGKEASCENSSSPLSRTSKTRGTTSAKLERSDSDKRGNSRKKKSVRESSKVITRKASAGSSFFQVKPSRNTLDHRDKIPENEVPLAASDSPSGTFSDIRTALVKSDTSRLTRPKTLGNTE